MIPMSLDLETKAAIDGALKAFNEHKSSMEALKTDVQTMRVKTDAFDQVKIDKLAKDVADGIEANQKAAAKAQAEAEAAKKKAEELETAFTRAPAAGSSEEKSKNFRKKVNKAFNDF